MDERRLEIKVGAFLLAAIGGCLALLYLMGELSFSKATALAVEFSHTGNVVKGAPVKLGGVPVGRVERIILTPEQRDEFGVPMPVRMELSVDAPSLAALRKDAAVTVATTGPLGEAYLELYPGVSKLPLPSDKPLRGVDAPRLDLVAGRLSSFLESASKVLEEDPRALSTLVHGVAGLSSTLDGVLTENRTDIHTLATELALAAKDLRSLSQTARANLEPGGKGARLIDDAAESAKIMRQTLPGLTQEAGKAVGGLAALSGGFTQEDGAKLRVAIDKYSAAGEKLERLADRGDRVLSRLEAGEGTAGKVLKDPQLYDDLKELVKDLRKSPWKMLWKD
jgi:phospholipid/cholesterol/gamma-HCH transport system substrate-binding protein